MTMRHRHIADYMCMFWTHKCHGPYEHAHQTEGRFSVISNEEIITKQWCHQNIDTWCLVLFLHILIYVNTDDDLLPKMVLLKSVCELLENISYLFAVFLKLWIDI